PRRGPLATPAGADRARSEARTTARGPLRASPPARASPPSPRRHAASPVRRASLRTRAAPSSSLGSWPVSWQCSSSAVPSFINPENPLGAGGTATSTFNSARDVAQEPLVREVQDPPGLLGP